MSTQWGVDGTAKLSTNTILEIHEWSLEEQQEPIEDTAMGDTSRTYIANSGLKGWNGSINCAMDPTNTLGQQAMTLGAEVALALYPLGTTAGKYYFSGNALIESVGVDVVKDGLTMRRFSFRGNGALTRTTV